MEFCKKISFLVDLLFGPVMEFSSNQLENEYYEHCDLWIYVELWSKRQKIE